MEQQELHFLKAQTTYLEKELREIKELHAEMNKNIKILTDAHNQGKGMVLASRILISFFIGSIIWLMRERHQVELNWEAKKDSDIAVIQQQMRENSNRITVLELRYNK